MSVAERELAYVAGELGRELDRKPTDGLRDLLGVWDAGVLLGRVRRRLRRRSSQLSYSRARAQM